ncbi:TPA: hypothetical protein PFE07_002572 [Kluyvera cryocrescens]|uniref:hypothetical protein n=1 Tax=Enterobacterales TaxID=91347 RepID=UPI000C08423E|nr:hypothetical protein [Erwinia amylovora]EIX9082287.1 hypothetical protein [Klebsiella aerogenes]HCB0653551.1 hypothetical protein [Klebsiella pneumoniae]HDG1673116.1 hypothetical protein [Kluyvera cryocrescens]
MNTQGILAAESGFNLELQILKSGRGFYIGTANEMGPVSRESEEYFRTQAKATKALENGTWTQRFWS